MLTLEQHFASGFLPAVAGSWFNLAVLLAQHVRSPVDAVREVVRAEVPRLKAQSAGLRDSFGYVACLAELAGFKAPAPPHLPEEYFTWLEAVHEQFVARLTPQHRAGLAHGLGHGFGDLLCAWNVIVVTLRMLAAAPGTEPLVRQLAAVREDMEETRDTLLAAGHHPNAPPALAHLTDVFSDALDELLGMELEDADAETLGACGHFLAGRLQDLTDAVTQARGELREEEPTADA